MKEQLELILSNNKDTQVKTVLYEAQKGALWLKGVGDFANPDKADSYHKTCSYGSASLLYRFIKEKL